MSLRTAFIRSFAAFALAALISPSAASAADNYQVKDASAVTKTMRAKDRGDGVLAPTNTISKADGTTLIDPATEGKQDTANASLSSIDTKVGEAKANEGTSYPAKVTAVGARSSGNLVAVIQADASVPIAVSTATTTQLVAAVSGKKIYITAWDAIAAGATNFKLVTGTGTNCGTGQSDLTGAYPLTAQAGLTKGSGLGPVIVAPLSQAVCAVNSAAQLVAGSLAYSQF